MRSRVIGGEFELIAIPEVKPYAMECFAYASGRAALYQILKSIKLATFKVWLPDWLCESMIDVVALTGLDYGFYQLGQDLRMDVKAFVMENRPISEHDAIVLVNYFGLTDVEDTIAELQKEGVYSVIIEDDVQALFSFLDDKKEHAADYRLTSLRKSIAAPDGGLVKTCHDMPVVNAINTFAELKIKGALLKGQADEQTDDNEYLTLFAQGEMAIEQNYENGMSEESAKILASTDLDDVAEKRRVNASYLIRELSNMGIEPLLKMTGDSVPLFIPITVENRNEVRRELRRNGIFCPVHWPLREDMESLVKGREMAEKELSLIVDQRYTLEDMECIAKVLEGTIWK